MVAESSIEIKAVDFSAIESLYPDLYQQVFDDVDNTQMPSIVYLAFKDGVYNGFMSGYLHNAVTLYIQYAGMLKNMRGFNTVELFRLTLREIDKLFKFQLLLIENINIPAIKLVLNEDFIIHGIRQDTAKNLYVEFIRGGSNGTR